MISIITYDYKLDWRDERINLLHYDDKESSYWWFRISLAHIGDYEHINNLLPKFQIAVSFEVGKLQIQMDKIRLWTIIRRLSIAPSKYNSNVRKYSHPFIWNYPTSAVHKPILYWGSFSKVDMESELGLDFY